MRRFLSTLSILICLYAFTAPSPAFADRVDTIGMCWMEEDGTIVLDLKRDAAGNFISAPPFRYPPSHKDYQMILKHVGPLRRGESKPVPPFPNSP